MNHTVCMVGLGYIGLPTAAMLASNNTRVMGVDVTPHVVQTINKGDIHIVEEGLADQVKHAVDAGFLTAHATPQPANVFMVAVPTPFKENHVPDISYVHQAFKAIAPMLVAGNMVIIESTSPVGTTEKMVQFLREKRPDLTVGENLHVAYCPERVLPGNLLHELVHNDRIIGGYTKGCSLKVMAFYKHYVKGTCYPTRAATAEMVKLSENAFRDVNIAFANELSMLAEGMDIDPWEVITLANHHPRVNILQPGCGVGGHCIAVDPWFLIDADRNATPLMQAARAVNDGKPHYVVQQVKQAAKAFEQPIIAVLGLSYKPNSDDMRESPALEIAHMLATHYPLLVVEPHLEALPETLGNATLSPLSDALVQCDVVVSLVGHKAFVHISQSLTKDQVFLDVCGLEKS